MMDRKEAANYLNSTLHSLVPSRVIDDVWDRVIAPLYDARTASGAVRTASSDTDNGVRTMLDTSGHTVRCGGCWPGYDPLCSCQE